MRKESLWVEKYRPQTIEECILPAGLKKSFHQFVVNNEILNLLLTGGPGVGKTTVARALCAELGFVSLLINGSEESGLDVLRHKIKRFASTVSLTGGIKVVILDEADYLNPQSTQPALRGFMEEFSANCRFIFTCNNPDRIIFPLHSRCAVVQFSIPTAEMEQLDASFLKRVEEILTAEQIQYEPTVLVELINQHTPDWRRVLNELQRYGASGTIDSAILTDYSQANIEALTSLLQDKSFDEMCQWVLDNLDNDPPLLLRKIYDSLSTILTSESLPSAVVIIADYSYKSAFVADQEINLVACLAELMASCEFKSVKTD